MEAFDNIWTIPVNLGEMQTPKHALAKKRKKIKEVVSAGKTGQEERNTRS